MGARDDRLVQLAMRGRILTPVAPVDTQQGIWTRFTDIWAGGCAKEPWDFIFIQAPMPVACCVFGHVFEHNPRNTSCACCGEEYSIGTAEEFVYNNALFIKAADILPEWTTGVYPVNSPDFVTISWDDITKSKFVDPTTATGAFLKNLEAELDKNSVMTAAGAKLEYEATFITNSKILGADDIAVCWPPSASDDLPTVVVPSKESLPPGMHYAYDKLPQSKKKKK